MSLTMILSRMWRNRRVLGVLLVAICLVTGFFALGPLYLRSVAEAALGYTIETSPPSRFSVQLRSPERMSLEHEPIIQRELGELVRGVELITSSAGYFCGERLPPTAAALCYRDSRLPIGFSRAEERFSLVEGRFPQPLTDRSEFDVEGIVTRTVAETSWQQDLSVDSLLTIDGSDNQQIVIKIVGIAEPINPDDHFWEPLTILTHGIVIDVDENNQRYDFGVILPESELDSVIAPISPSGMTYQWYLDTVPTALRASGLSELQDRLNRIEGEFRLIYPQVDLIGGLRTTIQQFLTDVANAEGPVILLSSGVFFLMLYQLITTVSMILEREGAEWATLTSRGGSSVQLIRMQGVTMIVLGVAAFLFGIPLAMLITLLLTRVGPLATILSELPVGITLPPPISFALSGIAALAAVCVLTMPAYQAARRGILRLKQSVSRPPTHPIWARYFLDFLFLAIGISFLLRLYYQVSGDSSQDVSALVQNPSLLLDLITSDAARDAGILTDPFNLAAMALLITGVALLWLRVFPLLMRLIGAIFARLNSLLVPLALWSVERDPSHYAHLVMLLIGTLALGTASLALSATHDAGAWRVAQQVIGSDVRVDLDPSSPDATMNILSLDGASRGAALMRYEEAHLQGDTFTTLFGVDAASMATAFPELQDALEPLAEAQPLPIAGLLLSEDTIGLSLNVYTDTAADGGDINTLIALEVRDSLGVLHTIPMITADNTIAQQFVTFTAELPPNTEFLPWRVVGFKFLSPLLGTGQSERVVFVDQLTVRSTAGEETIFESWERTAAPEWTQANQRTNAIFSTTTTSRATDGQYSLRIDYTIPFFGAVLREPSLMVSQPASAELIMPIIVSERFADVIGRRTGLRRGFQVGDMGQFPIMLGRFELLLPFRIVGVVRDFPTMTANDRFVIADAVNLSHFVNWIATPDNFFGRNQAWVALNTREPASELQTAMQSVNGVNGTAFAWGLYNDIRREPLPNTITGILFAGFWVSLGLGILDFGFYMAMTAQRRAMSFAVLRAMGWNSRRLWGLLTVEQTALVIPALAIGVGLGAALAYLLLPFLALLGRESLLLPLSGIGGLLVALIIAFTALLGGTAIFLQRMNVNQTLRLGEE
jgi:hypothetical protein